MSPTTRKKRRPPRVSLVIALALVAGVFTAASVLAENNNPSRVRVDYDPVTGVPTCTVVSSSDPSVTAGTVIPCPPPITARPPKTITSSTTTAGGGDATRPAGDGATSVPPPATPRTSVTIAGAYAGTGPTRSFLRLANFAASGNGRAQVSFIDPATGHALATWTGPLQAPRSSLQIDVAAIAAAATYETGVTALPTVVSLNVAADYVGAVAHVIAAGNPVTANASACGSAITAPRERLAYVPGQSATNQQWVRVVNSGDTALSVNLILRDAATGISLGVWASPAIPSHGTVTTDAAAIASTARISPALALMIDSDQLPSGLRLELVETGAGGSVSDHSTVCTL